MAQAVFDEEIVKRGKTTYTVLPEDIIIKSELSGRKDYTHAEIESLAADILANGQNTPVLLRKDDQGRPVLVYGRRRVTAIAHLNKHLLGKNDPKVRVEAKYEKLSDIEALVAAIGENRFRKETTPADDAFNIGVLQKKFKLSDEQVAEIYFPEAKDDKSKVDAVRWVKDRVALQELTPEATQAVREGKLKVTGAVLLAKASPDKQREVVANGGTGLKGGAARIKTSDIKAAISAKPAAKKAPAPAPAPAAAKPALPAVKPTGTIYAAAEGLAQAVEAWAEDATNPDKTEKAVLAALASYRALVPARKKEAVA